MSWKRQAKELLRELSEPIYDEDGCCEQCGYEDYHPASCVHQRARVLLGMEPLTTELDYEWRKRERIEANKQWLRDHPDYKPMSAEDYSKFFFTLQLEEARPLSLWEIANKVPVALDCSYNWTDEE